MSNRWQQLGAQDDAVAQEGDRAFMGVDMRRDPSLLEAGVCAEAVNKVFTQGRAETRPGMRTKPWARELAADFPISFPVDFSTETGFGKVWGQTVFSDPYGQEFAVLACENVCYRITDGAPIGTIKYPSGVMLSGPVTFTQAFNVLIMWRGEDLDPLKLETGTDFSTEFSWESVPEDLSVDYTSTIPRASRGLHYGNRVWVGFDRSRVAFSDLLAYTRYDADLSEIYVNSGSDDSLVALTAFGENAILACKDQSIYAISGVLPDPNTAGRIDVVTTERGVLAPDSIVQAGKDVLFLSDAGVYAISQALDNKLQAGSDPISGPIQPLMDRINWSYAGGAVAAVHDNRYYLAVPIDGATYNNAILVFDFLNRSWSGWWEGPYVDVAGFLRLTVAGKRRLVLVSGNSLTEARSHGAVLVLGEGYTDELFDLEADVSDRLLSRGYTLGQQGPKAWMGAAVDMETWHGQAEFALRRSGVNASTALRTITKDRTRSYVWNALPWDPTNVNGDHGATAREDYSVDLDPAGQAWHTGISPGLHQRSTESFRLRESTRAVQLEISGTRGRNNVCAITVSAAVDEENLRSKV
ncbi:MAG: hypothetical protein ACOYM3_07230 [Terrimicrobiaceae bacterium]